MLIRRMTVAVLLACSTMAVAIAGPAKTPKLKVAVFEFELENTSPTGQSWGETGADSPKMHALTEQARKALAGSGLYEIVDIDGVDNVAVKARTLRSCHGCDADLAKSLGADRSLIGVLSHAGSTEYYVSVRLTDATHHAVVFQDMAFFIGGDDSWSTGLHDEIAKVLAAPKH